MTFSEDVEESTVSLDRFSLARTEAMRQSSAASTRLKIASATRARSGSTALPDGATLENLGDGVWALSGVDSALADDGDYTLTFSADGVLDEAGNEAEGSASVSWSVDNTPPDPVESLRISPDFGASDSDGITCDADVTVLGTLPEDAATVEIFVRWTAGGAETALAAPFTPDGAALAAAVTLPGTGNMTLVVRCVDEAGNASETELPLFIDPLALTAALSGAPESEGDVADAITLAFSDAVNASTVALSDFALSRDGVAVPLDGAELSSGGADGPAATFSISGLAAICREDGLYSLAFNGMGVRKYTSGSPLQGGVSISWVRREPDETPPFVVSVSIDGEERTGAFFDTVTTIEVAFSEAVNIPDLASGGWIGQAVKLTRLDAGGAPVSAVLAQSDEISWSDETLTLRWSIRAGAVSIGAWRLALDAGFIADAAGNALAADGADAVHSGIVRFNADAAVAVRVNSYAMPAFGDFDGDGNVDLLVGEKSADGLGRVRLYRNAGMTGAGTPVLLDAGALWANGAEIAIEAKGCQGASAALLPRTGSAIADLVIGDAFGNVWLHRSTVGDGDEGGAGDEEEAPQAPSWGEGSLLWDASGEFGDSRAVVASCDLTGTGRSALVVGGMDGRFRRALRIVRATADAELSSRLAWLCGDDGETPLAVAAGRSAPTALDINGDGIPDLISGDTDGNVWAFLGNGHYSWNSTPISMLDAGALPDRSRVAAYDFAGGAPILAVGRSDGAVRLHSGAATPSPAFDFNVERTPPALPVALDAAELEWTTGGDAPWHGVWTDDGAKNGNAARSGAELAEGGLSWLETAFEGGGLLTFRWHVDGDTPPAGAFSVVIDGCAGAIGPDATPELWHSEPRGFADGRHAVRWTWTQGATPGEAAWLDAVTWLPVPWTDTSSQIVADSLVEFREALIEDGALPNDAEEAEFNAVALSDADGDGYTAWDEFIAGSNPNDGLDVFTAFIGFDEDGRPVVTYDPDLGRRRRYAIWGRKSLDDADGWVDVTGIGDFSNTEYRFFKATVTLPAGD